MKVLHTSDWHIGAFNGPGKGGEQLRLQDTVKCLEALVERAREERPELTLVSGDLFHTGSTYTKRCCSEVILAKRTIASLAECSGDVIIMRGTPNHDGDGLLEVEQEFFSGSGNVHVVTAPQVVQTGSADIAVLPGFDYGVFRAKFPGHGKEEENEIFSRELGSIVMGLRAQCRPDRPAILMAHYTVPGCNAGGSQSQLLMQFEPVIPMENLDAADYDLVALGHIHRPQELQTVRHAFYAGSINANNFNDEGQERGFWIHHFEGAGKPELVNSEFVPTPYREFITYHLTDTDITAVLQGRIDEVAMNYWRWNGSAADKIVRVFYTCSMEKHKALNSAVISNALYEDGAFWVTDVLPDPGMAMESASRKSMSDQTDPEGNLLEYLRDKGYEEKDAERLVMKARPIIAEALAGDGPGAFSGLFVPVEIEVENYRSYEKEKFNFEDIRFCTINGQNGAGKSSLFMDAVIDCLFEKSREGHMPGYTPWLRNDPQAKSGYILFTFAIGDAVYRVFRSRTKSGKLSLNLAEYVNGEWENRSGKKTSETQTKIEKLIGVDYRTMCSCAMIMQDQYGVFLQAGKDERMETLANLLGFEIYAEMEEIAKDTASEKKRLLDGKKKSIEVQSNNILAAGHPEEERKEAREELEAVEARLKEKNLELQGRSVRLATMQDADKRRKKLLEDIYALTAKKRVTGQNRDAERASAAECEAALAGEETVLAEAARYRELEGRKGSVMEGAALYKQTTAIDDTQKEIVSLEGRIREERGRVSALEQELARLEGRTDAEEIREKAALYTRKKEELDRMYGLRPEYDSLSRKKEQVAYALSGREAYFNEQERALQAEESSLRKRTELLEDSGCPLENAGCRFLADAVQARNLLADMPGRAAALREEREETLSVLRKELETAEAVLEAFPFQPDAAEALRAECEGLREYEGKFRQMQEDEKRTAVLRASADAGRVNTERDEERLSELKIKAQRLMEEREKHREDYLACQSITEEMARLEPWLEKERELPVIKERHANAVKRMEELENTLAELEGEIERKRAQAAEEMVHTSGLEELKAEVQRLSDEAGLLAERAKELQIRIGGYEQKISEIIRMKAAIKALQDEANELAEDAADYENIRTCFSQDGIPHQIILTVLPKLADTANNILGQMTGGQFGVEFRTEKIQSNKKERVTLDIFIEEYGKSSLPYLSKSGGEKVKASLSVILALAEIKAATVGIQFGMLFIDEPPFLDSDGIQAYCDALETIGVRYPGIKIMAITHDPTMKSRFPQSLDVIKTDNGSRVVY